MSMIDQFEVRLEAEGGEEEEEREEEERSVEVGERISLWSKSVSGVIVSLERLKGTPALYLSIFYGGEPVFQYGPFFSRKSFSVTGGEWEAIAAELEKRGGRPLSALKPSEWEKLVEEVRARVPGSPILPPVSEVGTPVKVTVEDLARRGDIYLLSPVEVDGIIIGRSEIKTVPIALKNARKEGKKRIVLVKPFDLRSPQEAVKFVTSSGEKLDEARFFILQLQQPMGHDKFTVFAVGCDVPKSKMVRVRGIAVSEGKKPPYRLVVLATEVEPLNEVVERLEVTPEVLKDAGFGAVSYSELKSIIDGSFAPQIRGRALAKMVYALTLFSVETLEYAGSQREGLLRALFYGDTKTGKSTIAKWAYETLGVGAYTVAETGSRAGLLYTIDTDTRTVIWGAVTLADREYAVVDGFDKMNAEEWKEFREAISNQKVVVAKKAQAIAPFRVRLILCANTEEPMSSYVYPVEGIRDIPTLRGRDSGASVTRIDLFVPFAAEDVAAEEIVEAALSAPKVDAKKLKVKLLLAWKASKAVFEEGALRRLQSTALSLIRKYGSMKPPVIHNDYFRVVLKVAAAFASLLGKFRLTRDGLEVVVGEDVVPFVERFFEEYLAALGVEGYVLSSHADAAELVEEVRKEPLLTEALKLIYRRTRQGVPISKSELGASLGIRDHNKQQQLVNKLTEMRLIVARRGVGITLTTEGKKVAALLEREETTSGGIGGCSSGLERIVLSETDYRIVREPNQAEVPRALGSELEETGSLHKPGSERELESSLPDKSSNFELLGSLSHARLSTPDQRSNPPYPQRGFAGDGSKLEPTAFTKCYLRLAQRLREEPNGLSEEELFRYAEDCGFSRALAEAVLQYMIDKGKVAKLKEGWLTWSG